MIGRTLSHYRIDAELGVGGMGVVYRARDLNLERDVALKVLPTGALADESARLRFRREALALSRLNHPHVGSVYDFGTEQGVDYLIMEYVPGESLADLLARGPLKEPDLIRVGIQIAEALEAAHEAGVIHRDLKPGNVVLTPRGQVKVLDFGLALLGEREGSRPAALTATQTIVGTLPYMAPEQLLGTPLDGRADLFSLGALLYEAASGRPPFSATLSTALVHEIMNRTPAPPSRVGAAISPGMEALILRCLEKDAERRHASARDLAEDLKRLAAGQAVAAAPPRIDSVAVLPLANLSANADEEYFADGMTEALISDLAKLRALRVVSRTSTLRYKGTRKPIPEIARELGVDAIVEGSVVRSEGRVRITAQLIEAARDRHLWSDRYDRDLHDLLAVQADVAQAIVGAIRTTLGEPETRRLSRPRAVEPEAHEAYLRGRWHWNRRTLDGLERALEFFNRAIQKDPAYAPAYAGVADCYNQLADNDRYRPEDAFPRAYAAAMQALRIDPELAEAHASLGYVSHYSEWDWPRSERHYRRSIELDPEYASAHQWLALLLAALGRSDEAITTALRAEKLDPLSWVIFTSAGDVHYYARRFDAALEHYRRGLEIETEQFRSRFDMARVFEQTGRYDEAIAEYKRALAISGHDPATSTGLACTYGFAGRSDDARRILVAVIEKSAARYVPPYQIASVQVALGEIDAAFESLERALAARDRAMVWLRVNPRFDRLRGDPRLADLARRVGLPG
jgi:serine/threonine-protein kinase